MTAGLRVLLLRARSQAEATATRLREREMRPVLSPLLEIAFMPAPPAALFEATQAVLVTSAHGVAALSRSPAPRDLPVLAVGDRTAMLAREGGFADVRSAQGTADDLAKLAARSLDPAGGTVLHLHGANVTRSPVQALGAAGFATAAHIVYRTIYREAFAPEAAAMLMAGEIDAVPLYSPKGAAAFAAAYARLTPAPEPAPPLIAISAAAARALQGQPAFRSIRIAAEPSEDAILKILDKLSENSVAASPHRG